MLVGIIVAITLFSFSKLDFTLPAKPVSQWLLGNNNVTKEEALNRFFTIASDLPELHYQNGELTTTPDKPHIIIDPFLRKTIAVINTTQDQSIEMELPPIEHRMIFYRKQVVADGHPNPYNQDMEWFVSLINQFPNLTFKNDTLLSKTNKPVFLSIDNSSTIAIIDTSDTITSLNDENAFLLFNSKEVHIKHPLTDEIFIYGWEEIDSTLLQESLQNILSTIYWACILVIFIATPFLVMFVFGIMTLIAMALTHITITIASKKNLSLSWHRALRLTCVALTPVYLLMVLVAPTTPPAIAIYILVGLFYIFYGVDSINKA